MPVGSNMSLEKTVENYFGEQIFHGSPTQVDDKKFERFANRFENKTVDDYLSIDEEIDQGVVFYNEEDSEAAYFSNIDLMSDGSIYMTLDDIGDSTEVVHGLARRFVDYSEPELGDWEEGIL